MRPRTGLAAALLAALAFGLPAAFGQEPGDRVVVTLTSGKKYSGTLVSRSEEQIVLKVGGLPVTLPSTMIAAMEKARAAEGSAPSPAGNRPTPPAPRGEAAKEPRPATILLKDGTVFEAYLVSKSDGRLWVVPGPAVSLSEAEVDEVFGDLPGSGGFLLTGDAEKDCFRLVKDLANENQAKRRAAAAALQAYGEKAIPALLHGLHDENPVIRKKCLTTVSVRGIQEAIEPTLDMLRNDPDAEIRVAATEAMAREDGPVVRRALLEAAWRDRDEPVRVAAAQVLGRLATVEEAGALIDLLNILPADSKAREGIFNGLRRSTGEAFANDTGLWLEWWESKGGREAIAEKVQAAILRRMEQERQQQ